MLHSLISLSSRRIFNGTREETRRRHVLNTTENRTMVILLRTSTRDLINVTYTV